MSNFIRVNQLGKERWGKLSACKPANPPFDLGGVWTVNFTWSVTSAEFEGTVSGTPQAWSFQGKLVRGGNAIWSAKTGQITCNGGGSPGGEGTMRCSVSIDQESWQGQSKGRMEVQSRGNGKKFTFRGRGTGINTKGESAGLDNLSLQPK